MAEWDGAEEEDEVDGVELGESLDDDDEPDDEDDD
jgi:hypothetical protein